MAIFCFRTLLNGEIYGRGFFEYPDSLGTGPGTSVTSVTRFQYSAPDVGVLTEANNIHFVIGVNEYVSQFNLVTSSPDRLRSLTAGPAQPHQLGPVATNNALKLTWPVLVSTSDECMAEAPAPAPEPEPAPAPAPEPEPAPAPAPEPEPDPAPAPEPEPAPAPAPEPEPAPAPAPEPEPDPAPAPEPEPDPAPAPEPEPDPAPAPEPEPAPAPAPEPEPAPAPAPEPEPAPAPAPEPEPAPAPAPEPEPAPAPAPEPEPAPAPAVPDPKNIAINYIHYDGSEPLTEGDEYVEIVNHGDTPADISGWSVYADDKGQSYSFPAGTILQPGQKIRVYTNQVHSESGGHSYQSPEAIWNNRGDTGCLFDDQGNKVHCLTYKKVEITHIEFHGQVKRSQADEYVVITNNGGQRESLAQWKLYADDKGQNYIFPAGTYLEPGQSLRVYTNQIHPESGGHSYGIGSAIWNDKGDEGWLSDNFGNVISKYGYGSKA